MDNIWEEERKEKKLSLWEKMLGEDPMSNIVTAVLVVGVVIGCILAGCAPEKSTTPPPPPASITGVVTNVFSPADESRTYRPVVIEFDDGRVVIGLDTAGVQTFKKNVVNRIYYNSWNHITEIQAPPKDK